MKIKIKIETPKGQAKGTLSKLKWFLLLNRAKLESYTNEEDNMIYLEVEGQIRSILDIQKRVNMFNQLPQMIMENKIYKKTVKGMGAKDDEILKVKDMFENGTKIDIIKEATAQEIVENNKTFWQRIKETFKRTDEE